MEVGEGGLLQVEGGAAGEALGGEVEEGEFAEAGGGGGEAGRAGDGGGGDVILGVKVESDLGVGAGGHLEVEDDAAVAGAEVEDAGSGAVGLRGFAEGDGVGDFARVLVETEVFERGSCVGEDCSVDDGTGLAGSGDGDGSLVAKVVRVGSLD